MVTRNDIRLYSERLQSDPLDPVDIIDVLWANLDPLTVAAIEKDSVLQAAIDQAKEDVKDDRKQAIRDMADKLPDGDPLKEAIDNVSSSPIG